MLKDFNDCETGVSIPTDICIIGAGAAGITVAREFINSRLNIVILESGTFNHELESQKLYESEVVGLPHGSIHDGRARVFGGTTTLWGGQALRFNAFDFQKKSWVPYSGWPITRHQLDSYYDRADQVLQLGTQISYDKLCKAVGVMPPAFDKAKLYMECSQWSPRPNFGTAYRKCLTDSANVCVILHANVTSIITNKNASAVEYVEIKNVGGKEGFVKARFYVICCGGIETARLLLSSTKIEPHGVGNRYDLVGRYFQEHLHIRYGDLLTSNRERLQELFESFYKKGLKYFPVIALSNRAQVEKRLLSIHGSAMFDHSSESATKSLKELFKAVITRRYGDLGRLRHLLRNTLTDPAELLRVSYRFYVQKRSATPLHGAIFLGAQCETAPNPNSRVMLSDVRDRLGMRRVRLDWRLDQLERRTLSEYAAILIGEFERLGLGTFDIRQLAALDDSYAWTQMVHDSAHHMGTARMHETPQFGVVDANCQVHGISNLYIGSSAVFPSSARSNPTLTILALCIRLADRLKKIA